MLVEFRKSENGRHCGWTATLPKRRPVPGSVMNVGTKRPPHDLVQFAIEAALGITDGFWGSVARGARFRSMPARRTQPGRDVIRSNRSGLDSSEVVAGQHFAAWEAGQPTPVGPLLDALAEAWRSLPPGESITVAWPSGALVEPVGVREHGDTALRVR